MALLSFFFFFNDTATTEIYTLSLHDALPISGRGGRHHDRGLRARGLPRPRGPRSEEHTSELQSLRHLVCRLLLEKKNIKDHDACGNRLIAYLHLHHYGHINPLTRHAAHTKAW